MPKKDITNYIVGGVVLIIIILLGWLLVTRKHAATASPHGQTAQENTDAAATGPSATAVTVADQDAGMRVSVASMELTKNSWVAVQEVSSGRILGAGWFPTGATSGEVELLRGTAAGEQYEAVIYTDDGDKKFDMKSDSLVDGVRSAFRAL